MAINEPIDLKTMPALNGPILEIGPTSPCLEVEQENLAKLAG